MIRVIDRMMDGQEKLVQQQYLMIMKLSLFYIFSSKTDYDFGSVSICFLVTEHTEKQRDNLRVTLCPCVAACPDEGRVVYF